MSVVAVGKSSFIAGAIRERNPRGWRFLSHEEALKDSRWAADARCVFNFALDPSFKSKGYDPDKDIDSRLAHIVADRPVHYIMMSSRMVYGQGPDRFGLTEDTPSAPTNIYGASKRATEKSLTSIVAPEKLTILRGANIFGLEHGRNSFFGRAMSSLVSDKRIVFDMDAESIRDFLSVWDLADALIAIAQKPVFGLYNLGSGFGTACGQIAAWLIEGYGAGELVARGEADDQYWLDMTLARKTYDLPLMTPARLRDNCLRCGRWLRSEKG
jgi:UDP-glucose 4-epimerase